MPLHRHDYLNPRQWLSKGIMSEILMDLRDEFRAEIEYQPVVTPTTQSAGLETSMKTAHINADSSPAMDTLKQF